ncbi:MAG TPA: alkaline phosphatase D family protein [Polyangiaceae bacterium]|nr:alkaline phosphatase D family protein [Polyangiaceae bacterium]
MPLSRRTFLQATPLALAAYIPGCGDDATSIGGPFQHGVASGDPLPTAVVIWTRVSVDGDAPESVPVEWMVASDPELTLEVASGVVETSADVDHTVKVDVTGLEPGTTYYYRFSALGADSLVARTRTARDGATERLRFALVSCSNYPYGFFNAYAAIARRADLDAVIHLGDYIYEYAEGAYGTGAPLGRAPDPATEVLTLEDYRRRHALYKTDPDLQEVHRQHPFIAVWDDHEVANDAWREGAENHGADEGSFAERKAAAIRAYLEWMPIRIDPASAGDVIYRTFSFGDLADLVMLDTRHAGRDQQVADACDAATITDPDRQLLGATQEAWLTGELTRSVARGARWRLIGQQVMMGQLVNVLMPGNCVFSTDQWDGYAAARARVLSTLTQNAVENVVVLTGDIHSSWGNDITLAPFDAAAYDPVSGSGSVAVEIVTPAVTSPGIDDPLLAPQLAAAVLDSHPHVKYVELQRRGYTLLDVTAERVQAEWYHVATIVERRADEELAATLEVLSGTNHLTPAAAASAVRTDAAPLAPPGTPV